MMHSRTRILSLVALAALSVPAVAGADTFTVGACSQDAGPPVGSAWASSASGGSLYSAPPRAWVTCTAPESRGGTWYGAGGEFGNGANPGGSALVSFTAPAGASITRFRANRELFVASGGFAEAGLFAGLSGRALEDHSAYLAGAGDYSQVPVDYDGAILGADGARAVAWGAKCPANLDPSLIYCGDAGIALGSIEITLEDPSAPTIAASAAVQGDKAILNLSAADPQSGLSAVRVTAGGAVVVDEHPACAANAAPLCTPTVTAAPAIALAPGQSVAFTITATNAAGAGMVSTQTVTATRAPAPTPAPLPTSPPSAAGPGAPVPTPTPITRPQAPSPSPSPTSVPWTPKVTLKIARRGKTKLRLSGAAAGCRTVKIAAPGRRAALSARVRGGRWALTTVGRAGKYVATCGAARAKRTAR